MISKSLLSTGRQQVYQKGVSECHTFNMLLSISHVHSQTRYEGLVVLVLELVLFTSISISNIKEVA